MVGRLTADASIAAADAEMRVIANGLDTAGTAEDKQRGVRVLPLRGGLTPWEQADLGPMFGLISIVPLFVLFVACANAANVLIAHHQARRREFAMRRAIGASRARLVRQLLAESFVLALGAAVAGAGAAPILTRLIVFLGDVPIDLIALLTPDTRGLVAATVTAVGAILMFGLAPAMTATRLDVLPILKEEGTTATGSRVRLGSVAHSWWRRSRCLSPCWSSPACSCRACQERFASIPASIRTDWRLWGWTRGCCRHVGTARRFHGAIP